MENGCEDRDECIFNESCENAPYVTCKNNKGSYECICDAGFTGNGTHCFDVDECASGNVGFSKTQLIFPWNFFENSKKWSPGTRNIRTSTIVDEIWAEGAFVGDCSIHSICTNTQGSRECECKVGFEGDGLTCQNINECELQTHLCSEFAHCIDINGDYNCQCWIGYSGNGIICENIDECSEVGAHNCNYYADCIDTDGSFECDCIDGFYGSGNDCLGQVVCVNHSL